MTRLLMACAGMMCAIAIVYAAESCAAKTSRGEYVPLKPGALRAN